MNLPIQSKTKTFEEYLIEANNGEPIYQQGKTKAQLVKEFKRLRYLQDIQTGNPLGNLWNK